MTPNIPDSSLDVFGPAVSADGLYGGVPWNIAETQHEHLSGLRPHCVVEFPGAPCAALLTTTGAQIDTDGPGGSTAVDPCWQRDTSLRYPDGSSCDSRTFPGVVASLSLRALGIKGGDFCMVTRRGVLRSAQVYDFGDTWEEGEFDLYIARGVEIIPATETEHEAAVDGDDADDVVTLFFPGSGPGHALPIEEIVAGAHACWNRFTARGTAAS